MRHHFTFLTTLFLSIAFTACTKMRQATEADLSDFGEYVYALDTLAMQQQLKETLRADSNKIVGSEAVKKCYAAFIDDASDAPYWFTRMGVSSDADSLLSYLKQALPANGLDATAFFIPEIAKDLEIVRKNAYDSLGVSINDVLPRLDYHLSRAFITYTVGQRYGFTRPARLLNHLQYKLNSTEYARLFDEEVTAPDAQEAVKKLAARDRLEYLIASTPTLPLYRTLQQELAKATEPEAKKRLAVNLERSRWQMVRPPEGERQVLVNIAAQQLWAIDPDSVLPMRICCGSTLTKSPLLHSEISYFQVNPQWVIPQTIVKAEVSNHAGDSAYFARNHYYILNRSTGDTLKAAEVTAAQLKSGRLRVAQFGGPGNSLGRIVFRFPNDFSVYLHDTNNPSAFNRERRTLSHGCIRVQKPFELAQFLLRTADDWTLDRLRLSMDLKPKTERGRNYQKEHAEDPKPWRLISYQDIKPPVPLYLIYYTTYPNPETGVVETYTDVYNYDAVLAKEMPIIH